MHLRPMLLAAAFGIVSLGGCLDGATPAGSSVAITVAPLSLTGLTEACYNLSVTNAPAGAGDIVWTRTDVCSSGYGDGHGALSLVGPCDAGSGGDNSVLLEVVRLDDASGPVAFANPCPVGQPCVRAVPCVADADTGVTFELTIARPAQQGFFDVAISFADLFCSAKVDCVTAGPAGDVPLALLFAPTGGARIPTALLAFACTGGVDADTQLYLGGLAVACGGTVVDLAVTGAAGNIYGVASPAPAPLLQLASYRGLEALADAQGASWRKLYYNVAVALDFDNLPGACDLVGTLTAADGPFTVPFTSPAGATYPLIRVAVPLVAGANATGYACTRHPIGSVPADGVWIDYTTGGATVTFDHRAYRSGAAVAVQDRVPLALVPSAPTLAVGNTQSFTVVGGPAPYPYTVVTAGGGAFAGSTYTAPSSPGSYTVRVTDAIGRSADTVVTVNPALALSPTSVSLPPGGSQPFSATGGVPPYAFSVVTGGGAFSGATYTAPAGSGSATVRVTDARANTRDGSVAIVTPDKVVFVSSANYNGNLGGLAGADAKCQALANARPTLAGKTFKAWLSSSSVSATARLTHATVPYKRVDGVVIANNWADLVDGALAAPVSVTEVGGSKTYWVWVNTDLSGASMGGICGDWTDAGSSSGGNFIGYSSLSGCGWTATTLSCSNAFALYCFEQ